MSSERRLALLWHLHQPEYRDPETGIPIMPWTRLHGLRGYRDLLVESAEHNVAWTLNIVPGLWEQILYYAKGGGDRHLDLTRRPVGELTADERAEIRRTFPCGNPVMRRTSSRYREIEDAIVAGRALTDAEIGDLQILSTLVWTGWSARRDHPELARLIEKDSHFDASDKAALLTAQSEILAGFPGLLAAVGAADRPAVSTTPLHHPILPLLIDLAHARRCQDTVPDVPFTYPQDASLQLERGRAAMSGWLGTAPRGCWPSEGSVSPETVALIGDAGFAWLATDDAVLRRSEVTLLATDGAGWELGHGVRGFFRDHSLSDRVGFDYARWPAGAAAADFFERADQVDGLVLVALDGENPWEAFADAGESFRGKLIAGLANRGVTLDEAADRLPMGRVDRLHTGSWIGADFKIWAGSPADARAWALLASCRGAVEEATEGREQAMEHILAAEGSDWFWWYGPEFDTPFAESFDKAFRSQLAAAWRAIGADVPEDLSRPVEVAVARIASPARPFDPAATGFAAWLGAGRWVLSQGAMARGAGRVVKFAWDREGGLWLSLPEGITTLAVDGVMHDVSEVVHVPGVPSAVEVSIDGGTAHLRREDWAV